MGSWLLPLGEGKKKALKKEVTNKKKRIRLKRPSKNSSIASRVTTPLPKRPEKGSRKKLLDTQEKRSSEGIYPEEGDTVKREKEGEGHRNHYPELGKNY